MTSDVVGDESAKWVGHGGAMFEPGAGVVVIRGLVIDGFVGLPTVSECAGDDRAA